MNYPDNAAYSATFAGKDYIDRQRIKRKAERWKSKYAALPPAERLAIMVALSQVNPLTGVIMIKIRRIHRDETHDLLSYSPARG